MNKKGRENEFYQHVRHCCSIHGCKYGDPQCIVVIGLVGQKYPCPECTDDDIKKILMFGEKIKVEYNDPKFPQTGGRKFDNDKPRWCLLPWKETEEIVEVLTLGSVKYEDHNWQRVPDARNRYFSAMHRHISAWWSGERFDKETGKSHLAHAGCCLLFLMWFDNNIFFTREENVKKLVANCESDKKNIKK